MLQLTVFEIIKVKWVSKRPKFWVWHLKVLEIWCQNVTRHISDYD